MQILELPKPSDIEQQHSEQLIGLIKNEIAASQGWISFSRYMELALYAPGLGYYSAGLQKFGEAGDFITAPEVSPLFAQSLAVPVAELLATMEQPRLIEFGAGSGILAAELLRALAAKNSLPDEYLIIELSAELKHRQQQALQALVPEYCARVRWLDSLPQIKLNAVVLANEVLDAMPVERFIKTEQGIEVLGVTWDEDRFRLQPATATESIRQAVEYIEVENEYVFPVGYSAEINLHIRPWLAAIANILNQGAVYLIDYGYPRSEYYLPDRAAGTLMCYYRHRAHDDALCYPGLQDITAFVDFTDVAESALSCGFDVEGFTSQGNFLLACGITERVEAGSSSDERQQLLLVQQMKTLTMPEEMGERFKVMGLSYGLDRLLPGFDFRDYRHRL
ncbi:MAG: SAM-dependent methyltransferase [Gammaproteobacteria bacterium]|nr:SAM-dependent methyltransferase [Gammaproteobacteria bacterium]